VRLRVLFQDLEANVTMEEAVFCAAALGGAALWTETYNATPLVEGYYSVLLGAQTPMTPAIVTQARYLQLTVNGTALTPRTQLVSVPFALVSNALYGGPVTAQNVSILVAGAPVQVNGRPVREKAILRLGDVVIAGSVRMVMRPWSRASSGSRACAARTACRSTWTPAA